MTWYRGREWFEGSMELKAVVCHRTRSSIRSVSTGHRPANAMDDRSERGGATRDTRRCVLLQPRLLIAPYAT